MTEPDVGGLIELRLLVDLEHHREVMEALAALGPDKVRGARSHDRWVPLDALRETPL